MAWAEKDGVERAEMRAHLLEEHPDLLPDDPFIVGTLDGLNSFPEAMDYLQQQVARSEEQLIGLKSRIADNTARKTSLEIRIEKARQRILNVMDLAGEKKVMLPEATLSIRAGTPKVIVTDEAVIPPYLMTEKITFTPDKAEIAARLNEGNVVPGAHMSNAPPSLTIRRK